MGEFLVKNWASSQQPWRDPSWKHPWAPSDLQMAAAPADSWAHERPWAGSSQILDPLKQCKILSAFCFKLLSFEGVGLAAGGNTRSHLALLVLSSSVT